MVVVHGAGEGPHVEGMVNAIMRVSHNESIARKIVLFVSTFIYPKVSSFLLVSYRGGADGGVKRESLTPFTC